VPGIKVLENEERLPPRERVNRTVARAGERMGFLFYAGV
jgi:hypothetical protein